MHSSQRERALQQTSLETNLRVDHKLPPPIQYAKARQCEDEERESKRERERARERLGIF